LEAIRTGSGAPAKSITSLQKWLKSAFGKWFKGRGNTLSHAVQDDGYSCGIITLNTLAFAIFGHWLWESTHTVDEILQWFIHLSLSVPAGPMLMAKSETVERHSLLNLFNPAIPSHSALPPFSIEKPHNYDSDFSCSSSSFNGSANGADGTENIDLPPLHIGESGTFSLATSIPLSSASSWIGGLAGDEMDIDENDVVQSTHELDQPLQPNIMKAGIHTLKCERSNSESLGGYNGDSSDSKALEEIHTVRPGGWGKTTPNIGIG